MLIREDPRKSVAGFEFPTGWLGQSEVYGHKRLRLHRPAVDQIRLVTPLLHRAICRLPEKKRSTNQLEVLDSAISRDPRLQYYCPLQPCLHRLFGIVGQHLLQQQPAGKIFGQGHGFKGGEKRRRDSRRYAPHARSLQRCCFQTVRNVNPACGCTGLRLNRRLRFSRDWRHFRSACHRFCMRLRCGRAHVNVLDRLTRARKLHALVRCHQDTSRRPSVFTGTMQPRFGPLQHTSAHFGY